MFESASFCLHVMIGVFVCVSAGERCAWVCSWERWISLLWGGSRCCFCCIGSRIEICGCLHPVASVKAKSEGYWSKLLNCMLHSFHTQVCTDYRLSKYFTALAFSGACSISASSVGDDFEEWSVIIRRGKKQRLIWPSRGCSRMTVLAALMVSSWTKQKQAGSVLWHEDENLTASPVPFVFIRAFSIWFDFVFLFYEFV